jgi:phosphatidylserine synthase
MLFSYKKGLFLYTPLFLVSLSGFIWLFRKKHFEAWSLLGFFALLVYVFSSWWNWWYGGSFSSRVFVEYLPFFAILLGYSLNLFITKNIRVLFISFIFLLILLCQVQTLQYRYLHIHWEEMTKEKYWDSFLRIDRILMEKSENHTISE